MYKINCNSIPITLISHIHVSHEISSKINLESTELARKKKRKNERKPHNRNTYINKHTIRLSQLFRDQTIKVEVTSLFSFALVSTKAGKVPLHAHNESSLEKWTPWHLTKIRNISNIFRWLFQDSLVQSGKVVRWDQHLPLLTS